MKKISLFTALALVSGWAWADVISLNFATDRSGSSITGSEQVGFVEGVAGDRWNNFTGANGTDVGSLRSVDQDVVDGLSVSWTSRNIYGWAGEGDAVVTDLAIKDYLDDGDGVTVTVAGVPYASYDVVIYTGCDNANKQFSPFCVNGVWYSWDATAGEVVSSATGKLDSWGLTRGLTAEYGRNTLRVRGLSGSTLNIRTSQPGTGTSGTAFRGTLGAVQIVETADTDALPAPDFTLSGVPADAPQGWFTAFGGQFNDIFQRIGPSGYDVLATANGYAPWAGFQFPNDFSCAVLLDVTDVNVAEKDATLLDFGNGGGGRYYLQLLKLRGTDNVQLAWCYNNTGASGGYSVQDAVTLENVPQGYHLYTITFSTSGGFTLQLDDGEVLSSREQSLATLAAGFQIGDVHGGKSQSVAADAMGVCAMMMWNGVLGTDVRSRLWNIYRPAVVTPIPYNYSENMAMRANNAFGTVSIPTMTDTGTHYLGAQSGTMHVKAKSVVNVNAIMFMNSSAETSEFVFNLDGEVNVSSVSSSWNVYPERGTRGILTGHWHGRGTYNIRGVLVGEASYWYTVYSAAQQAINIDGGYVKVRGIVAGNGNSVFNIRNGGTLEIADWSAEGGGAIPVHAGRGTLRAYSYDGSTGWTQPSRVGTLLTFDDAETGTTLDPNGLAITLTGVTSGAGKVIVEDTSDAGDGTVAFDSLNEMSGAVTVKGAATLRAASANGFGGTFDVQDTATLDLGASRPEGAIAFAEGTTVCLRESLADENGVVNLSFTGAPRVVMVRPDGVTPIEDARVVEEDGVAKIRYTPLAEPVVSGEACWYDFEFEDRSRASLGVNKGALNIEGTEGIGARSGDTVNDFLDDHALFTAAQSYMTITYPAQWSAAIYATVPQRANCAVMTFGTKDGGLIGLLAGAAENEVLLVRTTGNAPYEVLAKMTVPNAATSQHLYVFSKRSRTIDIYLDGVLWNSYTSPTDITLGTGFQIGSVHGSPGNTGIARFGVVTFYANPADFTLETAPDELLASYIGMLRLYDTALSSTALAALAAEFPYVSPNGLFTRDVAAADEAWTADGAWAQVTETGSVAVDAPAEGAMLQINGEAAGASLAVGLTEPVHFEALAFGGTGAVTLKKGGEGMLMNDGKTTVNTAVTIEYGAASIAGGPLVMGANGSVTFDYRTFPLSHAIPNQAVVLTGNSSADANVQLLAPTELFGRTFALRFNEETSQWQIDIARDPMALVWIGGDAGAWQAATLWHQAGTDADAGFLAGDTVLFGDLGTASATVDVAQDYAPAAVRFVANTTAYAFAGTGTITTGALTAEGNGAVDVANTIQLTGTPALTVAAGETAFHDLRGAVASATVPYGDGTVLFGTAGTLSLAGMTVGAGRTLVLDAAAGATISSPALTDLVGGSSVALRKTGDGTLTFPAGNTSFQGTLSLEGGRTEFRAAGLTGLRATEDQPLVVTGEGTRLLIATGSNGLPEGEVTVASLPNSAHVAVTDGATVELNGGNMFRREPGMGPIFHVSNGGELACVGANVGYDLRVEGVTLDDATLHFTGTTTNWHNRALFCTGGKLVSTGASAVTTDEGNPNRLDVAKIEVANGSLAFNATTEGDLVKTGAGMLELVGGALTGVVDVQAGGLKATETTAANNTTLCLASGTTLDLSALTAPFGGEDLSVVYAEDNAFVTINLGDRAVESDELLVAWGADGAQTGRYRCLRANGSGMIRAKADGLHFAFSGFTLILR